MSQSTSIEWTDVSWNPTHGCSKVSPGCAHCYAETLSLRYRQTEHPWTPEHAAENVLLKPHKLDEPLRDTKAYRGLGDAARAAGKADGKLVFVNSMSDLFHERIPDSYIDQVFAVMALASRHTFQILTKRPERMAEYFRTRATPLIPRPPLTWSRWAKVGAQAKLTAEAHGIDVDERWDGTWPLPNVWLGTSIENRRFVGRADHLRATPAAVRFISAEPLLGPLFPIDPESGDTILGTGSEVDFDGLELHGIDWLIVGGESGPGHRRIDSDWVRDLQLVAEIMRVPFLLKQWGGATPNANGRELDGRIWAEFPQVAEAVAA